MQDETVNIKMSREAFEAERLIQEKRKSSHDGEALSNQVATYRLSDEQRAVANALATAREGPVDHAVMRSPRELVTGVASGPAYHPGAIRWVRAILRETSIDERRELLAELIREREIAEAV